MGTGPRMARLSKKREETVKRNKSVDISHLPF